MKLNLAAPGISDCYDDENSLQPELTPGKAPLL